MDGLIDEVVLKSIQRRRARRRLRRGNVECVLRVVEGRQAGLDTKWSHGEANLSPGVIAFTPRASSRAPVRLAVRKIDDSRSRRPVAKEASGVNPDFDIWRVTTDIAVIEWGVLGSVIAAAADLVDPEGA